MRVWRKGRTIRRRRESVHLCVRHVVGLMTSWSTTLKLRNCSATKNKCTHTQWWKIRQANQQTFWCTKETLFLCSVSSKESYITGGEVWQGWKTWPWSLISSKGKGDCIGSKGEYKASLPSKTSCLAELVSTVGCVFFSGGEGRWCWRRRVATQEEASLNGGSGWQERGGNGLECDFSKLAYTHICTRAHIPLYTHKHVYPHFQASSFGLQLCTSRKAALSLSCNKEAWERDSLIPNFSPLRRGEPGN